jgi:hypothetical protein
LCPVLKPFSTGFKAYRALNSFKNWIMDPKFMVKETTGFPYPTDWPTDPIILTF